MVAAIGGRFVWDWHAGETLRTVRRGACLELLSGRRKLTVPLGPDRGRSDKTTVPARLIEEITSVFAGDGVRQPGGGGWNSRETVRRLGGSVPDYFDVSKDPGVDPGGGTIFLGRCPVATNVVLRLEGGCSRGARPRHHILRSPTPPAPIGAAERERIRAILGQADYALLNSMKEPEVVALSLGTGVRLFVVVTSSLPAWYAREHVIGRASVSVSLDDLGGLSGARLSRDLPRVARAVRGIRLLEREGVTGEVMVTLGADGTLVREGRSGVLWHVRVRPEALEAAGAAFGERACGAGDAFAAGAARARLGAGVEAPEAAREGTRTALRHLGLSGELGDGDFEIVRV